MADSIFPGEQPDRLEEECGVFGVYAPGEDVARLTCYGLQALQHRGQESAGIAVGDGSTVIEAKDLGLVTQVFDEATLAGLGEGVVAIGHVRYSTSGGKASWEAAQPHISAIDDTLIALAHNGTLVNTNHLRAQLIDEGEHLRAGTDSEVAAKAIGHLTRQTHHLREGIRYAMENLEGAYAMVLASPEALYAFRDPHGIRPLCIGQLPEGRGWVVSSETCGLDIVGAEYVRDVEPGEMVRFTAEVHLRIVSPEVLWPCFYGIDTDTREQLIAANMTLEEMNDWIGSDSLAFITLDGLRASLAEAAHDGFCTACFSGDYPVPIPADVAKKSFLTRKDFEAVYAGEVS